MMNEINSFFMFNLDNGMSGSGVLNINGRMR
jgi:hypothetical protein